jgi:hypothetical protein
MALRVDAATLAHSRIADLRIAGPDQRQVPYVVERVGEPLELELSPLVPAPATSRSNPTPRSRESAYRLSLPYADLPAARLVLSTRARVFRRSLRIERERRDPGGRREPWTETIATATWSHADADSPASRLGLELPKLDATELTIVVDEGDNSPLALDAPRLLLPGYRLRFIRPANTPLTMWYGHPTLVAARYDLALLAPQILGAPAEEIDPGPERETSKPAANLQARQIFWWVLVGAVLVLLALIVRLVGKRV